MPLLRVKEAHRPYRTADGGMRIGGVLYGLAAEIEPRREWMWHLVTAMDGTRTRDELVAAVLAHDAEVTGTDVDGAIAVLRDGGFVEDAAAEPPTELTPRDRERHGRGVDLYRWMDLSPRLNAWEIQARLRAAAVLLVGVGGTGGGTAEGLVASGVGLVHCVDPDVVELSNLNRQLLYREDDLGRPKVDAATERLRMLNSDVVVTGERRRMSDEADVAALLTARDYDLLVLCADEPDGLRRDVNRVCWQAGLPWVDGGYNGPAVGVGVTVPGAGACWDCRHAAEVAAHDLAFPSAAERDAYVRRRAVRAPVNAVSGAMSATLMLYAAMAVLTGVPCIDAGSRLGVNLMVPGEMLAETFPPSPDCPLCGALSRKRTR